MAISQIEQELACNANQAVAFEAVLNLLNNEKSADIDRVRLVMLYALRFERESPQSVEQLISRLAAKTSKHKAGLVKTLLKQAGFDRRTGNLFGNRDLFIKALNMARGLKVYAEMKVNVKDAVIALVDREREGEQIDRALLKNVNFEMCTCVSSED